MKTVAIPLLMLLTTSAFAYPPFDIVYLLDESGSISSPNFAAAKNFVSQSANGFLFGPNDKAASAITYSNTARVITNLTMIKSSFLNAVDMINQAGGSDDLTAGLTAAQNQFTAFGRTNAYRVLALLSDGRPSLNPSGIMPKHDELAAAGVHVFPIVVSGGDETYMQTLARNEGQSLTLSSFGNTSTAFNGAVALIPLPALYGDYNLDNRVDVADYTLWRKTLGSSVMAYASADGNGSSAIDAGDYNVWRTHFGNTSSGVAAMVQVPEPSTITLLLMVVVTLLSHRRYCPNSPRPV